MSDQIIDLLRQNNVMLKALLMCAAEKGRSHYHVIGGYAHGRTANGSPFVILFPADDKLKEKSCRVYSHSFKRLPWFVNWQVPDGVNGGKQTPDRDTARNNGNYYECPFFAVATANGKNTEMGPEKRFLDTIWADYPLYGSGDPIPKNGKTLLLYNQFVDSNGRSPDNGQELKNWLNGGIKDE